MTVAVLMSTYNGEKFLREQVDSIFCQLPTDGLLIVRDDGSSDGTLSLLRSLHDSRLVLVESKNIGFAQSFLTLISHLPPTVTTAFFADQDDVWKRNKIARALHALQSHQRTPALYCSRLMLTSESFNPLGYSTNWPDPPSFSNSMVENIATGCTIAMNREAFNLVSRGLGHPNIRFHDWWCYLVIAAFGNVVFDAEATIMYRQHQSNTVGMMAGVRRYFKIAKMVQKQSWFDTMYRQLDAFEDVFRDRLDLEKLQELSSVKVTGTADVIRMIASRTRKRQLWRDEVLFRAMMLVEMFLRRGMPFVKTCTYPSNEGDESGPTRHD